MLGACLSVAVMHGDNCVFGFTGRSPPFGRSMKYGSNDVFAATRIGDSSVSTGSGCEDSRFAEVAGVNGASNYDGGAGDAYSRVAQALNLNASEASFILRHKQLHHAGVVTKINYLLGELNMPLEQVRAMILKHPKIMASVFEEDMISTVGYLQQELGFEEEEFKVRCLPGFSTFRRHASHC